MLLWCLLHPIRRGGFRDTFCEWVRTPRALSLRKIVNLNLLVNSTTGVKIFSPATARKSYSEHFYYLKNTIF